MRNKVKVVLADHHHRATRLSNESNEIDSPIIERRFQHFVHLPSSLGHQAARQNKKRIM
jgi:hypothetical protein